MTKKKKGQPCAIPKPPPAGIKMPRLKHYRLLINSLLRPDRKKFPTGITLAGRQRALLIMFMAWMDAYDYPDVQSTILQVLRWSWGDSPHRRLYGTPTDLKRVLSEQPQPDQPEDRGVSEQIKTIFELALRENQ